MNFQVVAWLAWPSRACHSSVSGYVVGLPDLELSPAAEAMQLYLLEQASALIEVWA